MDLLNRQFPTDQQQMEMIRAGVQGRDITDILRPELNPVQQNQTINNTQNDELAALRKFKADTEAREAAQTNAPIDSPQSQVVPPVQAASDQSRTGGWESEIEGFNDFFSDPKNDLSTTEQLPTDNSVDQRPDGSVEQLNDQTAQQMTMLVAEGAKHGIPENEMKEFAQNVSLSDYIELYNYKKAKAAKAAYQNTASMRETSIPQQTITSSNASTDVSRANAVPRFAGSGAHNYNI